MLYLMICCKYNVVNFLFFCLEGLQPDYWLLKSNQQEANAKCAKSWKIKVDWESWESWVVYYYNSVFFPWNKNTEFSRGGWINTTTTILMFIISYYYYYTSAIGYMTTIKMYYTFWTLFFAYRMNEHSWVAYM